MPACTCADPSAVASAIKQSGTQISGTIDAGNVIMESTHETIYGAAMGGTPGAPAPVRFCHWAAPEISDAGESAWSTAFRAAAIAIALANGIAQAEISEKQQDLGESYYRQAKFKWDRFEGNYLPLELELLLEVSTTPVRTLDCTGAKNRAQDAVGTAYGSMTAWMTRQAKQFRLCIDQSVINMLDHRQSTMLVDAENYNLTDDQWFTDYKNDQRWNRRSNVLNLGRNLSSEALKYGEVARSLYGQVGAQIDRAANGLMSALGYYGARNDTVYPTTYLGSYGGANNNMLVTTSVPASANPSASAGANPAG